MDTIDKININMNTKIKINIHSANTNIINFKKVIIK